MPVNPTLPTDGGSPGLWGGMLNSAIGAIRDFVNGLETTVAGKAATVHGHAEADVTGLTTDLAALASGIAGKAPTVHSHAQADVTSLVAALAGKADTAHPHSAADITSGTLPVARGGTGAGTAAGARTALGLGGAAVLDVGAAAGTVAAGDDARITAHGAGVDIYRADTGSAAGDTASGVRPMVGYDTSRYADAGYTVSLAAGTVTVPADGTYLVAAHARFSAGYTAGYAQLSITDGTNPLIRGPQSQSSTGGHLDLHVSGPVRLTTGTVVRAEMFSSTSTSLVGDATGARYHLRVVRL